MANFLAVWDPDGERRRGAAAAALGLLDAMEGTGTGELRAGPLHVVWAAHPGTPVSVAGGDPRGAGGSRGDPAAAAREPGDDGEEGPDGGAVVWGEPMDGDGAVAAASDVLRSWRSLPSAPPPPRDGFFAAVGLAPGVGLVAEGDLLGLFPVYRARVGDVVLVGSSPSLLRLHPAVEPVLDLEGLVGVLLTGGPVGGRTLEEGIRRLAPGHLLLEPAAGSPWEMHRFTPPVSDDLHALPFREQVEAVGETLERVVARHARGRPSTLLLSGGRDSRVVGGAMDAVGIPLRALTLGRRGENEAYCAVRVARALGTPHRLADVPPAIVPGLVDRWRRWEHLVGNVSGIHAWSLPTLLGGGDERLVASGYLLEVALGGAHVSWSRGGGGRPGADAFLEAIANHAVPAERLRRLLRPPHRDVVDHVWSGVVAAFRAGGEDDWTRTQRFIYRHLGRFHAGAIPWRASFGAWPLLPVLDRELLELGGALPLSTVGDRRAQDELLRTRYRPLARVPLERHGGARAPLLPGVPRQALAKAAHHLPFLRSLSPERRLVSFSWRVYDPDGPNWRQARRMAEPSRETILDLFEPRALGDYVPPPDVDLGLADPVADGYGPRHLIGLMLWAGRHRR